MIEIVTDIFMLAFVAAFCLSPLKKQFSVVGRSASSSSSGAAV